MGIKMNFGTKNCKASFNYFFIRRSFKGSSGGAIVPTFNWKKDKENGSVPSKKVGKY